MTQHILLLNIVEKKFFFSNQKQSMKTCLKNF